MIATGQLNGSGPPDLVIGNTLSDTISIYQEQADGSFNHVMDLNAGIDVSDIQLADLTGNGRLDIVETDPVSGDVHVFLNQSNAPGVFAFTAPQIYLAGSGEYGEVQSFDSKELPNWYPPLYFPLSTNDTTSVAVADVIGNGVPDLIVTNPGTAHTLEQYGLAILQGIPGANGQATGSFVDPQTFTVAAGSAPTVVQTADLTGNGRQDIVLLNEGNDTVTVFLNEGGGQFSQVFTGSAGNAPTGLTIQDVTGDGIPDLLIGNSAGDVLVLVGKGDGTFAPYERVERGVPLAVVNVNGQDEFVFASQSQDSIDLQSNITTSLTNIADSQSPQPVLGPGAVTLADLNGAVDASGKPILDLIVANSGSNDVLIFLGDKNGDGGFGNDPNSRFSFFAGDNPVGITVGDVNGDGFSDLVIANEGSNDVSILYGSGGGSNWTMTYGPRLQTGGLGPVSTVVTFPNGTNNPPDILASNSGSNDIGLIPGVGQGLFNDTNPTLVQTGPRPGQILAVSTANGPAFVVLNTGSNTLTELTGFNGTQFTAEQTIDAGGFNPVAVVAFTPNGTDLTDLIVADANFDDQFTPETDASTGNLALLQADETGFEDIDTFSDPGMPNPSAVALSAVNGDTVFYATTEGVEHAFRFELTSGTQQTPLESAPGASAPVLTPSVLAAVPPVQTTIASEEAFGFPTDQLLHLPGGLLLGENAGGALAAPGKGPSILGSFDLLAFAEGGKGDSSDAWRRFVEDWEQARNTWAAGIQQSASDGWILAANTVRDATDETEALVGSMLRFTGTDSLALPDLQWRAIGKQMWQVSYGSVETTWTGTALAEMHDRFQLAFQEAMSPWMPAETPVLTNEGLPMLNGLRSTWQGLGTLLPGEGGNLPLQDTVEAVSRSLLDAIKSPTQVPPKPEPRPVWFAGEGSSLPFALQGEMTDTRRDWLFEAGIPEEKRNSLWLMLAAVAALPLSGPLSRPEKVEGRELAKSPLSRRYQPK